MVLFDAGKSVYQALCLHVVVTRVFVFISGEKERNGKE